MPDKKLTDSEIKKALGFCTNCVCNNDKDECPLVKMPFCKNYLMKLSLDLLNRLQAENEKLEANYNSLKAQEEKSHHYCRDVCEPKYRVKINQLKKINKKLLIEFNGLSGMIKRVKIKSYKECIEKVKEKANKFKWREDSEKPFIIEYRTSKDILDNILKELVGENI